MSGASGAKSELNGKWARTILLAVKEAVELESHGNSATTYEIVVKGMDCFGERRTEKSRMPIIYTDSSKNFSIELDNKGMKPVAIGASQTSQGGSIVPEDLVAIQDTRNGIAADETNEFWEKVKPTVAHQNPPPWDRSMATAETALFGAALRVRSWRSRIRKCCLPWP